MPKVIFPRLLAPIVGEDLVVTIDATTAGELRQALEEARPGVSQHLFDSTGALRPHVLCFVDDESTRLSDPDQPILRRSTVRIVQAVSGG